MMKPPIAPRVLRELLAARRQLFLFHANAVETSISYYSTDALLSREEVHLRGLPQADQYTDEADQAVGIYGDIFLNFSDFHRNFRRPNEYGPVTFRFRTAKVLAFLETQPNAKVSITKKNPADWTDRDTVDDRWFTSAEDFESAFAHPRDHENAYYFDGVLPDLVISGLPDGLPLELADFTIIEKNPELPSLREDFERAVTKLNSNYISRGQRILDRGFCAQDCNCQDIRSYLKRNIIEKFCFGKWRYLIGNDTYERWSREQLATLAS